MSSTGFLWLLLFFTAGFAGVTWGFISAKMQAKPWIMLAAGVAVTVFGAIYQFKLSIAAPTININPGAATFLLQMREIYSTTVSVCLSMGGALMGSAVSIQAARLYAEESNSILSMLESEELYIAELEADLATTNPASGKHYQALLNQLARTTDRLQKLEKNAKKLGLSLKRQ